MTHPKVANNEVSAVGCNSLNGCKHQRALLFRSLGFPSASLLALLYVANEQYLWMTEDISHFAPFLR